MKPDPLVPYNELPLLPPAVDLEPKAVLRLALEAGRELAQLKGYCATLPNPNLLVNSLILQEAKSSSEIENIVTTHDAIYQAMALREAPVEPAAREVVDYRTALWKGYELLGRSGGITINLMLAVQQEIVHNNAGIRALPGTALKNGATGETVYTPPVGREVILRLLGNLEQYFNTGAGEVDPLLAMAVAHYQFESIHPFYDGNGRTGRILNILYLVQKGLLALPVLYLSRYIIRNRPRYYELLQAVRTDGAWQEWVSYLLEGVRETSASTCRMIASIRGLLEETIELSRRKLPKPTYSKELVEQLFVQPYTRIEHLVQAGIAERRTASKYLKQLEEIGVLSSRRLWRGTIYINRRLYSLLTEQNP